MKSRKYPLILCVLFALAVLGWSAFSVFCLVRYENYGKLGPDQKTFLGEGVYFFLFFLGAAGAFTSLLSALFHLMNFKTEAPEGKARTLKTVLRADLIAANAAFWLLCAATFNVLTTALFITLSFLWIHAAVAAMILLIFFACALRSQKRRQA